MSYTNLLYHIVYATKERAPLITNTLRPRLHEYPGGTVRLSHDQCARVLDCSIAVIDQITAATKRRKAAFWLQSRQQNDVFDKSVFD